MILKRFNNFINNDLIKEQFFDDSLEERIKKAEERISSLEVSKWEKINGRWDIEGDINLGYNLSKDLIYRGLLLIPLGVINGNFISQSNELKDISLENLPLKVNGNLDLSHNHFKNLDKFHTKVEGDLILSHNHLHELKNMPEIVNGTFDINSNMLTSLEGCPKEVGSFIANDNWFTTAFNGPIRITEYTEGGSRYRNKFIFSGAQAKLGEKVPKIEQEWYSRQSYYVKGDNSHKGIVNYYTELYQYIINTTKGDNDKRNAQILSVRWPGDMDGDFMKKSITTISKFNL